MRVCLQWAVVLFALAPLRAQVDIGVTGGVPLTPFALNSVASSRYSFVRVDSAPRRYTLGPYLHLRLRGLLDLETGALYKRFGFNTASSGTFPGGPITKTSSFTTGNSWEFPILAQVHLRFFRGLRGFLSAGPSIRRLTGITETGQRCVQTLFPPPGETETTNYETSSPPGMDRRTSFGAALGVGVEFREGPIRLAPGFRVTRWDSERTSSTSAASRLARTQAEFLLAVAYGAGGREAPPLRVPCCFELGVLAGVPLLSASDVRPAPGAIGAHTSIDAPTRRYAVGALLDWRWHARWSFEASFLARRFGDAETFSFPTSTSGESLSGYSWEVPLLLKRRLAHIRSATVVLGGGPALRRASNIDYVGSSQIGSLQTRRFNYDGSFVSRSALGVALSGGLEIPAGRLRLRPELRYTWFQRPLYDLYTVIPRQDSLVFMLGMSWITARH